MRRSLLAGCLVLLATIIIGCGSSSTDANQDAQKLTPASPGGLVMYSDAGTNYLANSWCQSMSADPLGHVALESSDLGVSGGTDAIDLNFPGAVNYWDLTLWAPDNSTKDVRSFTWLLFDAKLVSGDARLRVTISNNLETPNGTYAQATLTNKWSLVAIRLSNIQGAADLSSIYKVAFKQVSGAGIHAYIDNIRFSTDSTGQGDKAVFKGQIPAGWGSAVRSGIYYDQRDAQMVRKPLTGLSIRYNYLRYGTNYGPGYIKEYIDSAKAAGQMPGFVIYGGFGTSASAVSAAMAGSASSWMSWYSGLLAQMKAADATLPYVLVIEPDLLGYLVMSGWSASTAVTGYGTLAGWAQSVVAQAHTQLPSSIVGHLVSNWGISGLGNAPLAAHTTHAQAWGALINDFGTGKGDVFFVEKTDRDAGYKSLIGDGNWVWGASQYQNYLEWIKTLSFVSGLRCIPWQISIGTSGNPNTSQDYTDDFAEYFTAHQTDFVNAGVIGVMFGRGAGPSGGANAGETAPAVYQTEYWTDNGRFLALMAARSSQALP